MFDRILYRLMDPHPKYGSVGRAYDYEQWKAVPWYDRALFEPVNVELSDYILTEKENGNVTEVYLSDPDNTS